MYIPFGKVITAMVTPFKEDGSVDYEEAINIAKHLVENGSEGILLSGTTGESPTTTHEEEYKLWDIVKKEIKSQASIIAGTGSNSTKTSIKATKIAEEIGLDGAMIVVPYYNKPSQEGLYQHFKSISDATSLPLIIYNIPGLTACNMTPETTSKLSEIKNFVALKAASGDLNQIKKTRDLTPADFAIYSGDDGLTYDILKIGGCGVISVASHLVGSQINKMISLYLQGEKTKSKSIHEKLLPLFKVLFITTNPTPIKAALNMIGFNTEHLRLPMISATEEEKIQIKKILHSLNII